MSRIETISQRGIYTDLLRHLRDNGHHVWIVTPRERSLISPVGMCNDHDIHILGVRTLNLQKTNILEKGLGQLLMEYQFRNAIRKEIKGVSFDLILYSTPPISFSRVITYLKSHYPHVKTYLLLKDIFPQNAVDLGMMKKNGIKGLLYQFFRRKEGTLYSLSDYIGCMSPANVQYLLKHNPKIDPRRVEVTPNSIELHPQTSIDRVSIRQKYGLPADKPIFIYGGNLGKPQGIDFLIECLKVFSFNDDCHFLILGSGTELPKIKKWYSDTNPRAVTIMEALPKNEYDELARVCDIGLVFLDYRFTIPNYPSRLLSYLENKMPIIAATDPNTDIGRIAEENGYGFWCKSNDVSSFVSCVKRMLCSNIKTMGQNGFEFLKKNYLVEHTYSQIMKHFQ